MKFRKKPIVIEAHCFELDAIEFLSTWIGSDLKLGQLDINQKPTLIIHTLEGDHKANLGDWIIKGVAGEFYSCKPDIFVQTYEPLDED